MLPPQAVSNPIRIVSVDVWFCRIRSDPCWEVVVVKVSGGGGGGGGGCIWEFPPPQPEPETKARESIIRKDGHLCRIAPSKAAAKPKDVRAQFSTKNQIGRKYI